MKKSDDIIRECLLVGCREYNTIKDGGVLGLIQQTKRRAYGVAKTLKWEKWDEQEIHSPYYSQGFVERPMNEPIYTSHKHILPFSPYQYQVVLRKIS